MYNEDEHFLAEIWDFLDVKVDLLVFNNSDLYLYINFLVRKIIQLYDPE